MAGDPRRSRCVDDGAPCVGRKRTRLDQARPGDVQLDQRVLDDVVGAMPVAGDEVGGPAQAIARSRSRTSTNDCSSSSRTAPPSVSDRPSRGQRDDAGAGLHRSGDRFASASERGPPPPPRRCPVAGASRRTTGHRLARRRPRARARGRRRAPTTQSTRPPAVSSTPSRSRVPAWSTYASSTGVVEPSDLTTDQRRLGIPLARHHHRDRGRRRPAQRLRARPAGRSRRLGADRPAG